MRWALHKWQKYFMRLPTRWFWLSVCLLRSLAAFKLVKFKNIEFIASWLSLAIASSKCEPRGGYVIVYHNFHVFFLRLSSETLDTRARGYDFMNSVGEGLF